MCSWNEKRIDENIERIKNNFQEEINKDEIQYSSNILETYNKIDKILNHVKEVEGENYIYIPSPFLGYIYDDSNIEYIDNDLYHANVIESVAFFLKNFNEDYYKTFYEILKKGLICLHRNNDGNNVSNHFIDPINKDCFIYVSSDNIGEEKYALVKQFGYVYQAMINNKEFGEDDIFFKDSFPLFLEMSMIAFYDKDAKESLVENLVKINEDHFDQSYNKNSKIIPISEKVEIFNENRDYYSKQIISNYFAMFMFLNNDIEYSFKGVDEFISKNHYGTRSSKLWKIANNNIEGIDHSKSKRTLKKNIGKDIE